jgi:hypothetical protein
MAVLLLEHLVCGEGNMKSHELTRNVECQTKSQNVSLLLAMQTSTRTEKPPNKAPIDESSGRITVYGTQYGGKNHTKCNSDWNYTSDVRTPTCVCIKDPPKYRCCSRTTKHGGRGQLTYPKALGRDASTHLGLLRDPHAQSSEVLGI